VAHILKLPLPKLFQGKYPTGIEFAEDAKKIIQEAIDSGNHPAAFITEAISGCGGQVPLAPGYLKTVKTFLEEHNILTIVDEVQTGFGRTGEHFWAFQLHDIIPDIVILGKPMGNGHPIAAVVTTEKIADAFANGMEFFSSFGGNTVSYEVATAVLNVIEEEQLQLNAKVVGNYFKEQLQSLQTKYRIIGDVRGHGLFIGIEFIDENLKPNANLALHVKNFLKDNFILTGTDGPFDNVLKIKPPMCFNKSNVDVIIEKLKLALN